ncbi:unnamed protein product [Durusdinium trenchii]|uniref:Uncharacterized protein n=1 Tax=Durusdinium trenchii TaxID=1381693 RepID=A0ABP0QPD0_9DINO
MMADRAETILVNSVVNSRTGEDHTLSPSQRLPAVHRLRGRPGAMQQPADDGDAQQGELPMLGGNEAATRDGAHRCAGIGAADSARAKFSQAVVLLLSCDELNPVKVLCSYTRGVLGIGEADHGAAEPGRTLTVHLSERQRLGGLR